MELKNVLLEDMKTAMRDKDVIKKDTVQLVRAAILQYEKDNKTVLDNEGVIEIIAKEVKRYKDVLPDYEKSGRQDLIDEIHRKIEILMPYLPEQMSEEEMRTTVKEVISQTGATSMKDIGKVMGVIMPKVKGRCDGRALNALIKEYLS